MSRPVVHRLGFTVLASGDEHDARPIANIVFVHGLRGHPSRTWEHPNPKKTHRKEEEKVGSSLFSKWRGRERSKSPAITEKELRGDDAVVICWPRDLLPQKVPNARILTYGYDADVVGGLFKGASKNNIMQHGRDLMLQLEREVNGEPIIFVAHSLGGILVKEGLHWSKTNLTPRYQALHRCTKHIVFLGVPHRGSPMANIGEILTHLANAAFQDTNRHIVSSLEVDGEILDRIHNEFMKMMHTEDFSVHSFQEGRGVSSLKGFSGKVVNDFSSKLDHPLELVETIDGNHMEMVRFGDTEDPGYRKVSSVIARDVVGLKPERSVDNPPATTATATPGIPKEKRYFRIPHLSNRYFVGRVKELEWLQIQFKDPSMHNDQRRVVIWGCGGAGKTQLVSTYAFRNQADYSAVFWVTASSEVTLKKTYADIARHLGLAKTSKSTTDGNVQQDLIDLVKDWFTDHEQGDWLLVIDNADNLDEVDIEPFIPPTNKGNVIITSRNRQAEGFGPAIELGEMDSVDAISLLLRRASINQPTSTDQSLASDITKSLGYLALAVEHAGAYVQSGGGNLLEYKEQFENNRRITLEKSPLVSMHKDSVFETFTMSFDKVKERSMTAAKLLTFLGFLDNEAIPETLILSDHEGIKIFKTMVVSEPHEFHAAVQELLSFSLIRVKLDGHVKAISLHPLVHYFSRARMTIEKQWRWTEIAITWLLQSSIAIKAYEPYYPHLREQLRQITSLKILPEDLKRRRLAWCYLGLLLQHYRHLWQNQGAMDELDKYAKIIMTVMEEDPNDRDKLSVFCTITVMGLRVQAVQFIECSDTYDEVMRRYVLKQMTPAAVTAWQNAHDTVAGSTTTPFTAATGRIQCEDKIALDVADLAVSVHHEVFSDTLSGRELEKEANDAVQQRGSTGWNGDVGSNLTNPKPRTRDTNINFPVSSTADITSVDGNTRTARLSLCTALEASAPLSSNEQTTTTESFPQALPSEISSPPSQLQYLSDIFLHTEPEIHIESLRGCLNTLARIYTYYNRTAEADLLLEYSVLPLNSSQPSNQPPGTSHLLTKASQFAAQKDLTGLLNTYQEILDVGPSEEGLYSLETMHCAIDYSILLNKQGRFGEAERVIENQFYGSEQAEEVRARELKDLYVWVRKSLARALGLQGRLEEEHAVLCETLRVAERVFGRNSLSCLHAMYLLRRSCEEHEEWRENGEVERYTKALEETFGNLYGAGSEKVSNAGFQMGMLLWAQGALEETVFVFELFATLATRQLGADDPLTRKARRAGTLAREEWASEKSAGPEADLLRFGTLLFFRKLDELALLVEHEVA